ncbi:hypothetical protein CJ030_MR4G016080 [Morella rubra]|uniref:PB1 domain-containing protein n=1 Tax=Morella rubra TaxID=262757 RepID=A0A6A1VYE3_9ROSI|nr:hypothetical protein CJ030_MR4G016080 [Morella rubra]
MDPQNDEFQPASSFMQDSLSEMDSNVRSPDLNMSEFKPVLNYSIQTGEEFALEFMRDRVNLRKPLLPNTDPNCATGYLELKGILGISHTGSESGSDISMLTTGEKNLKEKDFERKASSLHEDGSNYGSFQSVPHTFSVYDSGRGVVHGYASSGASDSSMKMKVLCSFGGKILPRPSDGKLRYVGGETRIISIKKNISWQELMQKALSIYNQTYAIKYQLPGEDLDALVSVSCDEDLQNMMEECSELEEREGLQKLRMFLFSMSDLDDAQFSLSSVDRDSEVQYVVAVNGMDMGSRKNAALHGLGDLSIQEPCSALGVENLEVATKQVRLKCDGSVRQKSDTKNICSLVKVYTVSLQPYDSNLTDTFPVEEAVVMVAGPEGDLSLLTSKSEVKHGKPENLSASADALNQLQVPRSGDDEHYSISSNAFDPGYVDSESSAIDLSSIEQPVPPQRSFYSERIPREQAELLNRSSKSDDSHGSQFLMSHSRADAQQDLVTKCIDKLHARDLDSQTEQSTSTAKLLFSDAHTIADGLTQLQQHNEFTDSICQINSNLLQNVNCELKHESPNPVDNKDAGNEKTVLNSDHATNCTVDGHKKPLADEPAEAGSELPAVSQVDFFKHHKDTISDLPQLHWSEAIGKGSSNDGTKGDAQPFPWMESSTEDVSLEIPFGGESTPVQREILIDINDRFPRDILSDIFSKAILSEDSSRIGPLEKDGAGLSLNMENHEPKRWSYFQKLAQEGFVQKDISLIDQDHPGFSSAIGEVKEGDHASYHFTPSAIGVSDAHVDSELTFGEDNRKGLPGMLEADNKVLHSNYDPSQVNGTESMQFDDMMENLRMPESECEEGTRESRHIGLPPLDPSLGDFDLSTLQV